MFNDRWRDGQNETLEQFSDVNIFSFSTTQILTLFYKRLQVIFKFFLLEEICDHQQLWKLHEQPSTSEYNGENAELH